jgi:hypothetical protein
VEHGGSSNARDDGGGKMSCTKCEEEPIQTWVRIGNGNVMVVGCQKHLRELMEILSKNYEEKK